MKALENLARTGQLIEEPTSVEEISGFLMCAEEQLIDARTSSLSAASRFSLAYDAAHAFALVALRAHGQSGNLGRAQEFQTILDAAIALREDRDIVFLFIGGGAQQGGLAQEAARRQVNAVFKSISRARTLRKAWVLPTCTWSRCGPNSRASSSRASSTASSPSAGRRSSPGTKTARSAP